VLGRLGALSRQRAIVYWSASRGEWRPMLDDAAALAGPEPATRREDFGPQDFRPGATLHVLYDDSDPLGPVVYRITVLDSGPDRLRAVSVNTTPGRLMGFNVAEPGDLSSALAIRREPDGVFRYHVLTVVRLTSLAAAMVSHASHVNRAVAIFRYVAGLPSEGTPSTREPARSRERQD
jgi:hypothetical protein